MSTKIWTYLQMKSMALSVVVITVSVLLVLQTPRATADSCSLCFEHKWGCFRTCGSDQSCVNSCNNGYKRCRSLHCSVSGRVLRRDEAADLLEERYKSKFY